MLHFDASSQIHQFVFLEVCIILNRRRCKKLSGERDDDSDGLIGDLDQTFASLLNSVCENRVANLAALAQGTILATFLPEAFASKAECLADSLNSDIHFRADLVLADTGPDVTRVGWPTEGGDQVAHKKNSQEKG